MGSSGEWSWSATWLPIVCNNLLSWMLGIRRRNPAFFYCTGSRVRFEDRIHRTWNVLSSIRLMTPIRICISESTDNRPRDLYWYGSLGMFLVSLLYERKCLRSDLIKRNCCLNVPFIICFFFFFGLNSVTSELLMQSVYLSSRTRLAYLL